MGPRHLDARTAPRRCYFVEGSQRIGGEFYVHDVMCETTPFAENAALTEVLIWRYANLA